MSLKAAIVVILLALVGFFGYWGVNSTREQYHVQGLRNQLFEIAGGIDFDLANRERIVQEVVDACAVRRFTVDPEQVTVASRESDKLNTAQQYTSRVAKIVNQENRIEATVNSHWLFFRHRTYEISAYHLVQKSVEQRLRPDLEALLKE